MSNDDKTFAQRVDAAFERVASRADLMAQLSALPDDAQVFAISRDGDTGKLRFFGDRALTVANANMMVDKAKAWLLEDD